MQGSILVSFYTFIAKITSSVKNFVGDFNTSISLSVGTLASLDTIQATAFLSNPWELFI